VVPALLSRTQDPLRVEVPRWLDAGLTARGVIRGLIRMQSYRKASWPVAELQWIEFDESQPGPRRELIARDVETGRTVGVRVPAAWTDVEVIDALDPDFRPVVEALDG
jgi:hypothetical protein